MAGAADVTACIVARDEASILEECIMSLQGAAAEILLVDNGSTDDTAAIAARAGARVIRSDSPHHEIARNTYLEAAHTPWVVVIDADERLSSRARVAIPALVAGAAPHLMGFALKRFDWIGAGRWAETRLVRLFRVDPRIRYFPSRAHASVVPAIEECGGFVATADAPLHHLDALLPRDHAAKRAGMRARLEAEVDGGGLAVMRCFLALELFANGDDDAARAQLRAAVIQNPRCTPIARLFRAQNHRARGRFDEAARVAQQVLDDTMAFRGRTNAWTTLADARDRLGDTTGAVAACRAGLVEDASSAAIHLDLAALLVESERESAGRHFEAALRENPWLVSPETFAAGAPSCVFRQQDSLLARVPRGDVLAAALGVDLTHVLALQEERCAATIVR